MRAALVFAMSLLAQAPTVAPPVTKPVVAVPHDRIARAKFSHVNPALIDKLAFINLIVNAVIQPETDQDHYGIPDLWVMAPSDGKGDCEDYAITKYLLIEELADQPINPVTEMKLVGVMVGKDGHAVLAIRLPNQQVMYLDNLNNEPMTRRELERQGYRFSDWVA